MTATIPTRLVQIHKVSKELFNMSTRHPLLGLLCLAIGLILTSPAAAQTNGRNMTKEAMFWEQLKVISPDSVETFKAATTAMDSEKYDDAVTLYQSVYKKTPHFDVVMRRLGMCLALQGKTAEGL